MMFLPLKIAKMSKLAEVIFCAAGRRRYRNAMPAEL